jgi:hypothetical protein
MAGMSLDLRGKAHGANDLSSFKGERQFATVYAPATKRPVHSKMHPTHLCRRGFMLVADGPARQVKAK